MLQCELEDLMHWAEIAAINLWLKPDNQNCGVLFLMEHDFKRLNQLAAEQNSHDFLDKDLFNENIFDTVLISSGKSDFSISAEDLTEHTFHDDEPIHIEVIEVNGLWQVEFSDIERYSNKAEGYFTPQVLYSDSIENSYFILDLDAEIRFKFSDLLITRSDLEKLHFAITTGELLKSRFNDSGLASQLQDREKLLNSTPKQDRLTPGKAKAVTALTELVLKLASEDADLINNPHKLHKRINELMLEHKANKDGGYNLGISDTAYRDLIGVGRSAQKKDGKESKLTINRS